MKKASIVLGTQFGDEGKGLITDYLCAEGQNPIVIRFSGGHQAGHTVVNKDRRHVFSHFGSGSFRNVPTYWTKYCTFAPIAFMNEYDELEKLGVKPKIYVDALCPVTTPYDSFYNKDLERQRGRPHGSCGVGFGATMERNETPYKLYVQDLFFPEILEQKMEAVRSYYYQKTGNARVSGEIFGTVECKDALDHFYYCARLACKIMRLPIVKSKEVLNEYGHFIFEGSQGILLDMDFGFFPNVTRSNTTSKNALEILKEMGIPEKLIHIYYVTRAYQTRHGNGHMTNENEINLKNNENETNIQNEFQGRFRTGRMDLDLLNYAVLCDMNFSAGMRKHLAVTCLDQLVEQFSGTHHGKIVNFRDMRDFLGHLSFLPMSLIESRSDDSMKITETTFNMQDAVKTALQQQHVEKAKG